MKKHYLFAFSLLLVACNSKPYVQPSSGSLATLLLPAEKSQFNILGTSAGDRSHVKFAISDDNGCGELYKLAEPVDSGKKVEYKVPASKDIFISYFAAVGKSTCSVNGYAKLEPNKTYEVTGFGVSACSVLLTEKLKESPQEKVKVIKLEKAYLDTMLAKKVCKKREDL